MWTPSACRSKAKATVITTASRSRAVSPSGSGRSPKPRSRASAPTSGLRSGRCRRSASSLTSPTPPKSDRRHGSSSRQAMSYCTGLARNRGVRRSRGCRHRRARSSASRTRPCCTTDSMSDEGCALCNVPEVDAAVGRVEVWRDAFWRLTTSVGPGDPTPGFSYLEPLRHIRYVHELDGEESATFGPVLARCTAALKEATSAELVYVYI